MVSATRRHSPIFADRQRDSPAQQSVVTGTSAARFLLQYWLRILGISACVLVPCFWHPNIEAGDLSSHTYNAWLAQLIEGGRAPGLWLARQSTNVLFDLVLSHLGNLFGLRAAERIVVAVAVLLFFWGAFALVCAFSRRVPWFVLFCLAMFAYGWTFESGLMNYYISLGLSFWALAIVLCGRGWQRALAAPFVPLIWMAHPAGVAFVITAGAYVAVAKMLPPSRQLVLVTLAGLLLLFGRLYLAVHYPVTDVGLPFYFYNGLDQLLLYGPQYLLLAILLLAVVVGCLANGATRRSNAQEPLAASCLPLQLYVITILAARLVPNDIYLPQYNLPLGAISARLTSVSAVLMCCVLGMAKPRKWVLAGFAIVAAVFFLVLFRDTGTLNRMEIQAQRYERTLPTGQRVITAMWRFPGSRIVDYHFADRSCIGHCFSYGNYEPPTKAFRVRAYPGNSIVAADSKTSIAIGFGEYVVRPRDLPLFQIYPCGSHLTELCMRELASGETNGNYGLPPAMQ